MEMGVKFEKVDIESLQAIGKILSEMALPSMPDIYFR